jgi:peroxiredoxin
MRKRNWQVGIVVCLLLLLVCSACQKGADDSRGGKGKPGKGMADQYREGLKATAQTERKKAAPEPPPAPKMPEVKMPAALAQTCLVKVGSAVPQGDLVGLDGKRVGLYSLLGKRLTVVLFWQAENMYATQALEYLEPDVVKPFADKGVKAIGINVKDPPDAARKAVEEAGAKYANLLDPEGAYFAKVATERIPRVYLLDPAGKVLWYDIEYSTGSRRDLERAIRFVLGEK